MVIDAHTHIWEVAKCRYAWLMAEWHPIHRTFTIEDALLELRRSDLVAQLAPSEQAAIGAHTAARVYSPRVTL
jgi:hypothetical protein